MRPRLEKAFTMPKHEAEYTVPNNFLDLNELAAQPPIDRKGALETEHPPSSRSKASIRHSYLGRPRTDRYLPDERPTSRPVRQCSFTSAEEEYTIPDSYGDLNEVAAPSPIESRYSNPHDDLETRLSLSHQGSTPRRSRTSKQTSQADQETKISELAVQRHASCRGVNASNVATSPSSSDVMYEQRWSYPGHRKASRFATEMYTISYLVLFSIFGTLARLGLQALTFYPGAPVQTGVLWCNFGGSLIMGFLSEDQKLFREHFEASEVRKQVKEYDAVPSKSDPALQPFIFAAQKQAMGKAQATVKKTIPMYIGLATGFCGSFTSFSSFIHDAYLALSNALPVPVRHTSTASVDTASTVHRNGGYSFMAICAVVILTIILGLGALVLGSHLAVAFEPLTPHIPSLFARRFIDRSVVLLAWGAWLGAISLAIWPPDRPDGPLGQASWAREHWRGDALFALVFAPIGCLLRFYVSLHLNGKVPSFPLGTFAVNIFGTAMESMFYDLQHVPLSGRVGCQVLQGLMDGFCGCLTTVSTWVLELKGLRVRHAYIYGVASVSIGVSLMVVIMGSLQWTRGFRPPLCPH